MKHGARLARVELTAGRQRDAERVTVRVKKIVENVVPDPDTPTLWLFYLLVQVRKFIVTHNEHFKKPLRVIIDEGLCKAGFFVKIPRWNDLFRDGQLEFRKSHDCAFLQLADFAAFVISRGQWLLGKGDLKPRDIEFLRIISAERLCVINLPLVETLPDRHTTEIYDNFLKKDRQAKRLKKDPPKRG